MRNSTIALLSLFAMAHASTLRHGKKTSMLSADTLNPATEFSFFEEDEGDFGSGDDSEEEPANNLAPEAEEPLLPPTDEEAEELGPHVDNLAAPTTPESSTEPPTSPEHNVAMHDKTLHDSKLERLETEALETKKRLSAANAAFEGAKDAFSAADVKYQEALTVVRKVAPKHFHAEDNKARAILKENYNAMSLKHIQAQEHFHKKGVEVEGIQEELKDLQATLDAAITRRAGHFQSDVDVAAENRRIARENYEGYQIGTALKKAIAKSGGKSGDSADAAIREVAGPEAPAAVHTPVA